MRGSMGRRPFGLMAVDRRGLARAPSGMASIPSSLSKLPRALPRLTPGVWAGLVGVVCAFPTRTFEITFCLPFCLPNMRASFPAHPEHGGVVLLDDPPVAGVHVDAAGQARI